MEFGASWGAELRLIAVAILVLALFEVEVVLGVLPSTDFVPVLELVTGPIPVPICAPVGVPTPASIPESVAPEFAPTLIPEAVVVAVLGPVTP